MVDEPEKPENLVLHYLRRLDEKVSRSLNDIGEVKTRLGSIETRMTSLEASIVHVHERMDGMQKQMGNVTDRLDRIERLELADAPAGEPV
jgi:predicted  nucleic acid-binding Zn-ribbon protein